MKKTKKTFGSWLENIVFNFKRVFADICLFIVTALLLKFKDIFVTEPALQLLVFKALLVNAGVIHAHITRKLAFPYIDFNQEGDSTKKWMIIAIYVVIIYAYSHGG